MLAYSLYTLGPQIGGFYSDMNLVYTIFIVAFGLFRFLYLVLHDHRGEDPATLVFHDKQILAAILCWLLAYSYQQVGQLPLTPREIDSVVTTPAHNSFRASETN